MTLAFRPDETSPPVQALLGDLGCQQGQLRDDATVILIEWQPERASRDLIP